MISLKNRPQQTAAEGSVKDSLSLTEPLWTILTRPGSFDEYAEAWLAIQGNFIETAQTGILRIKESGSTEAPVHHYWPAESPPTTGALFDEILERAEQEKKGVVFSRPGQENIGTDRKRSVHISFPILLANDRFAAAAFEICPAGEEQLRRAMRQLQWGIVWLQKYFFMPANTPALSFDKQIQERLKKVFDLLSTTLDKVHCTDAAAFLTTDLATLLRCDRVTVGLLEHSKITILALSHSAENRQKTNIIEAITAALEESADQGETIHFPAPEPAPGNIYRAHEALASQYGCGSLLTVPFLGSTGEAYGAMLFERTGREPFEQKEVVLCEAVATLAGPALRDKHDNDLPLRRKAQKRFRQQLEKKFGPGNPGMKLTVFAVLLCLLFLALGKGDFTISAEVTVSGEIQRAIIAPFASFVTDVQHGAGDRVKKDAVLASLDTSDLTLEQLKWASRKKQADLEYRKAVADNLTAAAKIILEQKKQAEIQLSLLDLQRQRTKITAPFGGLLVQGDLSQSIGAPVERGQILFEIVPDNAFRVILEVDERDIGFIAAGQDGTLLLNGLPQQPFTFTVEKITPVSTAAKGRNSFKVEGKLMDISPRLRPGMKGYGRIHIGRQHLVWIWSRTILDRIRIWFWSVL